MEKDNLKIIGGKKSQKYLCETKWGYAYISCTEDPDGVESPLVHFIRRYSITMPDLVWNGKRKCIHCRRIKLRKFENSRNESAKCPVIPQAFLPTSICSRSPITRKAFKTAWGPISFDPSSSGLHQIRTVQECCPHGVTKRPRHTDLALVLMALASAFGIFRVGLRLVVCIIFPEYGFLPKYLYILASSRLVYI